MQLWIVGRYLSRTKQGVVWEFQGVHATEAEAVAACSHNYFVGPVRLGESLPPETVVWAGCYYPLQEEKP